MSPHDVVFQAEAFVAYWSRSGLKRGAAWERWIRSKDLSPADERRVAVAVAVATIISTQERRRA